MKKVVVVLKLARLSIPKKIEKARFIVTSMTGNANFTTPSPTLATITANVNALETAAIASAGGGVDETANMHAKELTLDLALKSLAGYVEGIANANPVNAESIALSAGMDVKTPVVHTAREFHVSVTGDPGEVKLATKFEKRATFMFQMCTNTSSESNWQTIMQSTRSKFVKSGLISGTRYYFRVAVININGQGAWSNVLSSIAL
ncbi:MAG: fibronectin type III domain-containing protein [Bacteroidetes bacterium]|nr:fibronectin type III domain-containing protein [Bacteroidota bacterium]